ncbi:GntR family transcriptional regulator [Jiangella alkaliphila]|uniref:DNA-binding transcriptional regulator, GntR family n=1 Tax=Jiangella alkaliphila TaxID=419479 RepID=A0A1H2ISJ3_9ACTN|nr:GntR family transcriptional regulator [Jiangella alkaliphila]SDU47063.1 DNA-binding transcriptional regulator, GntR family [Jiangella alkaliphila]
MTSTPAFTEIPKREGLRVRVAQALRAAIVSGEMEPGDVYSAPSLGQHFGISATPVREALLDLVGEGLMSTVPNKGFRVTEVSERDLAEITELLLLVEPPAVRRAIASILGRDIPALRELARSIVDRASAGDLIGYNEAERRFHLELLGHAGNQRVVDLVAGLRDQTRLHGLAPLVEQGALANAAAEHLELVDLIVAGDGAAAEALMRRHLRP